MGNHTLTGIRGPVRRGQLACAAANYVVTLDQNSMCNVAWHGRNSSGLTAGLVQSVSGVVLMVTLGTGLLGVRDAPNDVGARWAKSPLGGRGGTMGVDSQSDVVALVWRRYRDASSFSPTAGGR